jgi:methyltransferase (TIGR00027 family)
MSRTASRTALLVAAYRARIAGHTPSLCNDTWARGLAGDEGEELAKRQDPLYPHMELWVGVRTAYFDAHVTTWTGAPHAFRQVVVLGAGLDMRAFRLPIPGVRFFEVDHPASQADKFARLAAMGLRTNDRATYVSCDFEHERFIDKLVSAGFDARAPAVVLWEGVTPYLPARTVAATLGAIAGGCDPRSIVVFDHLLKKVMHRAPGAKEDTQAFVDALGERVVWGTNDPVPMLYEAGFRHVRSLDFNEVCLTMTGTYDRAREFRFQRVVWASCTPPGRI